MNLSMALEAKLACKVRKYNRNKRTRNILSLKYELESKGQICPKSVNTIKCSILTSKDDAVNHMSRRGDTPATVDLTGYWIKLELNIM